MVNNIQTKNIPSKNIPGSLGISVKDSEFYLQPTDNPSQVVSKILSWILTSHFTGMDIPFLCDDISLRRNLDKPVLIGKNLTLFEANKDNLIQIRISDDEMVAHFSIKNEVHDVEITSRDCLFKMLQSGIRRGFQVQNIQNAFYMTDSPQNIVVALGQPPQSGENSEIIFHEELLNNGNRTNGNMPPGKFIPVIKDEVIAQKLPAKKGVPGFTVRGKLIYSENTDLQLPQGENTYIGEDNLTLYSAIDGYLHWDEKHLSVHDILKFNGDVDFHTGDIKYDGRIIINGDISGGIRVESKNDINISGFVEGSTVISHGGTITIHKGVNGHEKSEVIAKGDIHADYIQDAWISAGGNIIVERYVARSSLDASGYINILNKEGLVRGGVLRSEKNIVAKVAGSSSCMNTQIIIQPKLTQEENQKLNTLQDKLNELEIQQNRIRRRLDFLSLLNQRNNSLIDQHKNEAQLLSEELIAVSQEILDVQDEQEGIKCLNPEKLNLMEPLIIVEEKIYPGVKFIIEDQELLIQNELNGGKVKFVHGKIILRDD